MKTWLTCCSRGIVPLILLLTASAAWAQATAQLSGTVRDESGAVLPGVTVTVTQTDTGLVRTAVTDDDAAPTCCRTCRPVRTGSRSRSRDSAPTCRPASCCRSAATPTINAVLARRRARGDRSPSRRRRRSSTSERRHQRRSSTTSGSCELPLQGRQVTDLIVLAGAAVQTGACRQPRRAGRREHLGRRRPAVRRRPTRSTARCTTTRRATPNLPLPFPDALQEFQRRDQRALRAERHAVGRVGERRDQVGHQSRSTATRSSSCATAASTRRSLLPRFGPDGKQTGRRPASATSSAARSAARSCATSCSSSAATRAPSCVRCRRATLRTCRRPRCWPATSRRFASPACNGGRQITLGAPFVDNRIDPARFSPAAMNLAARLPTTTDPCGQVQWSAAQGRDIHEADRAGSTTR